MKCTCSMNVSKDSNGMATEIKRLYIYALTRKPSEYLFNTTKDFRLHSKECGCCVVNQYGTLDRHGEVYPVRTFKLAAVKS